MPVLKPHRTALFDLGLRLEFSSLINIDVVADGVNNSYSQLATLIISWIPNKFNHNKPKESSNLSESVA